MQNVILWNYIVDSSEACVYTCIYMYVHWVFVSLLQTSTVGRSIVLDLRWVPFEFDIDQCAQSHMLTAAPQQVSLADVQLKKFLVIK